MKIKATTYFFPTHQIRLFKIISLWVIDFKTGEKNGTAISETAPPAGLQYDCTPLVACPAPDQPDAPIRPAKQDCVSDTAAHLSAAAPQIIKNIFFSFLAVIWSQSADDGQAACSRRCWVSSVRGPRRWSGLKGLVVWASPATAVSKCNPRPSPLILFFTITPFCHQCIDSCPQPWW